MADFSQTLNNKYTALKKVPQYEYCMFCDVKKPAGFYLHKQKKLKALSGLMHPTKNLNSSTLFSK